MRGASHHGDGALENTGIHTRLGQGDRLFVGAAHLNRHSDGLRRSAVGVGAEIVVRHPDVQRLPGEDVGGRISVSCVKEHFQNGADVGGGFKRECVAAGTGKILVGDEQVVGPAVGKRVVQGARE